MHLMEKHTFDQLKQRNNQIFSNTASSKQLDPLILPGLFALSKQENITTIFSCSGHPMEHDENSFSSMYVMFGVHDQVGMDFLYLLYKDFCQTVIDRTKRPALVTKIRFTLTERISLLNHPSDDYYPVIIINVEPGPRSIYEEIHHAFNIVCHSNVR